MTLPKILQFIFGKPKSRGRIITMAVFPNHYPSPDDPISDTDRVEYLQKNMSAWGSEFRTVIDNAIRENRKCVMGKK